MPPETYEAVLLRACAAWKDRAIAKHEEARRLRKQALIATAALTAISERRDAGAEGAHCATIAEDALIQMSVVE